MADIWLGRFERWLEKYFNAKGGGVVADFNPSMVANIQIFSGNEDRYLQNWNRYIALVNTAAVAAQFAEWRFRNPVGSNVVAVIERLSVASAVSDLFIMTVGSSALDLPTIISPAPARLDPRGAVFPTMIISSGTSAAASGNQGPFISLSVDAGDNGEFVNTHNQEYPVLPGFLLDIKNNTVNTPCAFSVMWRERPLESSELT